MTFKHWVNLIKDNAFVGDGIASIARIGDLHFECNFKKGTKPNHFKARIVPVTEESYSRTERGRNRRFRTTGEKTVHLQADKKHQHREATILLPAAGGNVYEIEAKSGKTTKKSSKQIKAYRRLYYQMVAMSSQVPPGAAPIQAGAFVAQVASKLEADAFIQLIDKNGGCAGITFRRSVYGDAHGNALLLALIRDVKSVYTLKDLRPFAMAIAWICQSPTPTDADPEFDLVTYPTGYGDWAYDPKAEKLTATLEGYLWDGLDDPPIPGFGWLRDVVLIFQDASGAVVPKSVTPPASIDKTFAPPAGPYGGYKRVEVNLAGLTTPPPGSVLLGVRLDVRFCDGFSNGFAFNAINLLAVADQVNFGNPIHDPKVDPGDNSRKQTFIHELGHKLGMVPRSLSRGLDRTGDQYYGRSHQGSHCKKGVAWSKKPGQKRRQWTGVPGCVMFGSDATGDGPAPQTFCARCDKDTRRVDLGPGNPGFVLSVMDY